MWYVCRLIAGVFGQASLMPGSAGGQTWHMGLQGWAQMGVSGSTRSLSVGISLKLGFTGADLALEYALSLSLPGLARHWDGSGTRIH